MKESFMNAESLFNENAPIFRFSQLRLKLKVKTIYANRFIQNGKKTI